MHPAKARPQSPFLKVGDLVRDRRVITDYRNMFGSDIGIVINIKEPPRAEVQVHWRRIGVLYYSPSQAYEVLDIVAIATH